VVRNFQFLQISGYFCKGHNVRASVKIFGPR
jgi:hypothetical protein